MKVFLHSLTLFFSLSSIACFASYEIGLGASTGAIYFRDKTPKGKLTPSLGFEAYVGYKLDRWMPYMKLDGKLTRYNHANLTLFNSEVTGNIPVRMVTYSLGSRFYLKENKFVFFAPALSTSSLDLDDNGIDIKGGSLQRRYRPFLDGYGFQFGYGYHPYKDRVYIQISYECYFADHSVIEEEIHDTSNTIFKNTTGRTLVTHGLFITIGFSPINDHEI